MPLVFQLPNEYGYVLSVAASSLLLNAYQVTQVSRARKAAGLRYPIAYATAEEAERSPAAFRFNCAQRAHGNLVENYAPWVVGLLLAGLRFPVASAAAGAAWLVGRVLYARGYVASGPEGRGLGFGISALADLALKGLALWTAVGTVLDGAK